MERIPLKADVREEIGKETVKKLRAGGIIPAVVYKKGLAAIHLKLSKGEFVKALHTEAGENVLIDLMISGKKGKPETKTVIIKEIQSDPVKGDILHVDFKEISLTEAIKIKVPLVAKGEAAGVVKDGGVLEQLIWEVEVECLPTAIPEHIEIDVTNLELGKSIFIKNLISPEGVKILGSPEVIIVSVKTPHVEKVPVPGEEVPTEEVEPEVIKKGKEEVAEEEEEAAPPAEKKEKEKKE